MLIYLINFILVFIFGKLSYSLPIMEEKNSLGDSYVRPVVIFKFLMLTSLILTYALRWKTGTDTPGYITTYYNMWQYDIKDILEWEDRGFFIINWVNYRLFNGSLLLHNIVLGIVTYCPVFYLYEKYSSNYPNASIFAVLTTFYYFAFNGQRQAVAIGICIIAYLVLLKKKHFFCVLILGIAAQIHSTAFVMTFILLIIHRKTTSKVFLLTAAGMFFSAFFMSNLWEELFIFLDSIGQEVMVARYAENASFYAGSNILRFGVVLVPTILGIWKYPLLSKKYADYDLILNLNINTCVWFLAGTYSWLFARIAQYTMPFLPILLIREAKIFSKNTEKLFLGLAGLLFFIYMIVYIYNDSNLLPYYFINDEHLFY